MNQFQASLLRSEIVGRWLRLRAAHAEEANTSLRWMLREDVTLEQLFTQLAADAEHSDLLYRLFIGEQPLPYDQWKERFRL